AKHRDVAGGYCVAGAAEQRLRLGLDHGRVDALAAQLGPHHVQALCSLLALHLDPALVGAFPDEHLQFQVAARGSRGGSASGHGSSPQSFVTRLISARLVIPFFTLSSADWRRSRTPERCAASVI